MEYKKMKKVILATFIASAMLTTGCATILTEDTQQINVTTSNGESVETVVDGQSHTVPGIVNVKKENKNKVLVVQDERCTSETALNKEVESAFFVNILSGGVFGSTTDYSTEKMWKYQDNVSINCK
ncbi:adenosine deaminase [Alteromonas sp. ASW11-130]|uniref:adenosine deaminase n=1 Tax=Alteromonas sp. ASW11-130 TaxID=3015775 RepID=UPI0022425CF1|nr:adenosine deaminase [Alteromonas sp. ASW11-130]MCW8090757.1 adenosine deaminase [Alteromonas sp. ASW11-130]